MKPKHNTGYLTPQANKNKHNSKLKRIGSNENLNVAKDLSDSFFQKLMSCPLKRQLVLNLIKSEKDNIEAYKRNLAKEDKRKEDNASSLSKIKRNYQCESPTALLRRRALQQQSRQNVPKNQEKNESNSTSRSSSRQSSVSSCSSPIPFDKLLDGVVAYVEIKSKDQDRSSAVKALMKSMGATVRDKFTKDVTHVVFKDGSFTTYQKAILMKVHLVSVLWIEAVRSNNMRVSEKKFPALGTETYDSNVSSICSQLQKEYEGIIRDEFHRSLITGTPLPSTQTLIDRRRTILTPIPGSSGRFSQEFVSSQDKEVDKILHCHTKTSGNYLAEELATELPSDDDSDIGPFINGRNIRRRSNLPSRNLLESNINLNREVEESNMDLTFLEEKTPPKNNEEFKNKNLSLSKRMAVSDHLRISNNSFSKDAKENCIPHSSGEDIYYRKTPKLKKTITILRSKSEGENKFSIPNDNTYKKNTRILRSNSQSRLKANGYGSSTNMSVLESSDKSSDLQILSKNVCVINVNVNNTALNNIFNTISNATVDKSSSTNMSSLQISSNKQHSDIDKAGISTSTDLSTLMISSNSSKAKSTNIDKKIKDINSGLERDLIKESTRERTSLNSKESFSPINSACIKDVIEMLDSIPAQEENITKRRKRHSVEKRKIYNTRRRTISHPEIDKTESDQNTEDDSASSISPQSKIYSTLPKKNTKTLSKDKGVKIKKSKKTEHVPLSDSFNNLQITPRNENCEDKKKTASENRPLKKNTSTNVAKQVEDNSKSSDSSQESSQSNGSYKKLNKTRKLYDPNESIKEMIITNDQSERECRRNEVQKRKSDGAAAILSSNIVTISPNTLLTTKAKKFVDQNNINLNTILNKESEESESEGKVAKKRKTKKIVKKKLRNSNGDEQHQLAEEFLNKQNDDKIPKKSAKKSTTKKQEVIRRRKSARLTQYSKKKLKFDGSTTSSDEGNIVPVTPVINRRSTMQFQTKSQMSSNKKLKIDKTKRPSIVCTKLHKQDNQVFNQIVRKLGGFVIEDEVSSKTTHLVAGEPKRTINMLRAMTMGCWILKHEWLLRSLEEGRWLPEEDYEETDFSSAVQQCRLQRQAFGPSYTMDLFQECGPIYIAKGTTPRCSDLQELVLLCKGIICSIPRNAAIAVGEYIRYEGVKCVKEAWVLDSITFNKRMPLNKYIITPSSHSPVV